MTPSILNRYTGQVEGRLRELLDLPNTNKTLNDSMNYSVSAGGKRIRPTLNILANGLLDGDIEETLDVACAIEMIHTYSLIHDDLPAMDNDELRRGKPTSHIVFGEAFAILTGDALLNYAFEVMIQNALGYPGNMAAHLKAIQEVAQGAGVHGMINGQCEDIENEGQMLTENELAYIHRHKTGKLIKASLLSGLLLCSPSVEQIEALTLYGYNIGMTFQITDDILDITGDEKKLGKSVGKDEKAKKFTYPTLYGLEGSRKIAKEKTEEAQAALRIFGMKADPLIKLSNIIMDRDR